MSSMLDDANIKTAVEVLLTLGVLTVQFTKKNGEQRTMRCTTCPSVVEPYEKKSDRVKAPNLNNKSVWDVELKAWRSIPFTYGNDLHFTEWHRFSKAALDADPHSIELEGAVL